MIVLAACAIMEGVLCMQNTLCSFDCIYEGKVLLCVLFHSACTLQLMGLSIMVVGVWAWTEKDIFNNLSRLTNIALDPAFVLIVIGGITFIIGFTGCVGALRENTCLLAAVRNPFLLSLEYFYGAVLLHALLTSALRLCAYMCMSKKMLLHANSPEFVIRFTHLGSLYNFTNFVPSFTKNIVFTKLF